MVGDELKRVGVQFFVPNFCTPNRWTTLSSFVPRANDGDPGILFLPSRISPAHYRLMALPLAKSINEEPVSSDKRFELSVRLRSSFTIAKVNAFALFTYAVPRLYFVIYSPSRIVLPTSLMREFFIRRENCEGNQDEERSNEFLVISR